MLHVRQLLVLIFGKVARSSYTHGAFVPGKVLVERRRVSVTPLAWFQPAWANCSHPMTQKVRVPTSVPLC